MEPRILLREERDGSFQVESKSSHELESRRSRRIIALGAVAAFEVMPGAGFFARVAMLATGVLILVVQLIARDTSLFSSLSPSTRPNAVTGSEAISSFRRVQRRAEARPRGWHAKMKEVSGSICTDC